MCRGVPSTLDECLAAPLAQVARWGLPSSRLGGEQRWNIAEDDSLALREYGDAVLEEGGGRGGIQLVASLQSGNDPLICRRGVEAYSLGSYWHRVIGVAAGSGEVVGVSDDDTKSNSTKKAAAPADKSASGERRAGLGFGFGLVVLSLKFLF